jgi:hypothetical protein
MTKQLIILFLFFSFVTFGQCDKIVIRGEPSHTPFPEMFLVVDTINIKLDSISVKKIDPKWINKVEVIKEEKYKNIYGDKGGVIMLYAKRRYYKKIFISFKLSY